MKKSLIAALALSIASLSTAAETKFDALIVSATGFSDSQKDVGYNIQIIDKSEIKERGYKDVKEALSSLAGVNIVQNGIGDTIDIRAQGENVARHVKTFIDGILVNPEDTSHLNAPINAISIDDIEQIEVIPGGGSVVYGSGAVGGVVNIITKASLNKNYANVSLKAGSFDFYGVNAGAGHKFGENFYANFSINASDEKGYQKADINKFFSTNLGLKALFDNQSLGLDLKYMQSKTRQSFALSEKEMSEDRRAAGSGLDRLTHKSVKGEEQDKNKNEKKSIALKYALDINDDISLLAQPYYQEFDFNDKSFIDKKMGAKISSKIIADIFTTHIGYEFLHNKGERKGNGATNEVKKQSHSIWALENIKFSDAFALDFGARYERANYDINRVGAGGESITGDADKNAWAANVVASANVLDDAKIYAKIERGYTLPGAFELTDKPDGITYKTNDLRPESYMSYEIGSKGLIADQFVSASIFYTETKDEIFNDMSFGFDPMTRKMQVKWTYENISKTQRYGVEFAANESFFDDTLELYQNISFINAKVKSHKAKSERNGEKIPQVSPFNASIGASYAVLDNLKLRGDYNFYSKSKWYFDDAFGKSMGQQVVPLEKNDRKAYGLLNLGVTYSPLKDLDVKLDVKNVLGEKYNLRCEKDGKCNPAAKQSFYVQANYSF